MKGDAMKYSSVGFRPFYYQFVLFPIEALRDVVSNFAHAEDADSVLAFGYIDHETGFRFEILGTADDRNGELQIYNDRPRDERIFIKAETVSDIDGIILENEEDIIYKTDTRLVASIITEYEYSEDVKNSRRMAFLDGSRDLFNVDDVQVHLSRRGYQAEACWVRIEGLEKHFIIGKLLNEPYQDFGYHLGDTISFCTHETEDSHVICVSDMNPSVNITKEDLEDGQMLRDAIKAFNRERNEEHLFNVLELLRDSDVWIPCTAILSEKDQAAMEEMIKEAGDDLSSVEGKTMISQDQIRMVPDILRNGESFFFPVFSGAEEMGEYGNGFSKIETGFLNAIDLARNNEKKVKGIVIDAFSESFVVDAELLDLVEKMKTRIKDAE